MSQKIKKRGKGSCDKTRKRDESPKCEREVKKMKPSPIAQMYPRQGEDPPSAIDYMTFGREQIPPKWGTAQSAKAAAEVKYTLARLMGYVTLEYSNVSRETVALLTEPFHVTEPYRENFHCNFDGEYTSGDVFDDEQIPLTRLHDGVSDGSLCPLPDSPTSDLMEHLYALQQPGTSNWNIPFIRIFSRHKYNSTNDSLSVKYYVYFSRLAFELISDEAVKCVMQNITVTFNIKHCTPRIPQPSILSQEHAEMLQLRDFRFSLPGLLKRVESTGYGYGLGYPEDPALALQSKEAGKQEFTPPAGLNVTMYDFQKSTYLWMMDQERDEGGLNGHFWEEWQLDDGGEPLYYFPLGGEFRFDKPPIARGGLLCEEMGLGKTIEVLALILGNPATVESLEPTVDPGIPVYKPEDPVPKKHQPKDAIRATLIIVPPTLAPQWWEEIKKRTTCGVDRAAGQISAINMSTRLPPLTIDVPANDVRAIFFDEEEKIIIERNAWGTYTGEQEVEIRSLPFVTPGVILRGFVPAASLLRGFISTVKVFIDLEDGASDADIVLTTYSALNDKRFAKMLSNFQWHRIVLDECQEVKIATNQVAQMCAKLSSERRWMVSGTPLCSKVSDLHGELNFLKVWPFCLPNNRDGFWDLKVEIPWENKDESALTMLYGLLDVVMIRHCKNQRYLTTGAPLVDLPSRTIEWRGFEQSHGPPSWYDNRDRNPAKYIYEYIESFAAEAMTLFLERNNIAGDATHQQWMSAPHASQLKSLYSILSRCLTHRSAVSLQTLDHLKRMLGDVAAIMQHIRGASGDTIPLLSLENILSLVQGISVSSSGGSGGGNNHESMRVQASVTAHEAEQQQRDKLMSLTIAELTDQVLEFNLPRPITWISLPYRANIDSDSKTVTLCRLPLKASAKDSTCEGDENEMEVDGTMATTDNFDASRIDRKSLHDFLMVGDKIRLSSVKHDENEFTIARVFDRHCDPHNHHPHVCTGGNNSMVNTSEVFVEGDVELSDMWSMSSQRMVQVYKQAYSTRKATYIDLLVANAQAMNLKEIFTRNEENGQQRGKGEQPHDGMLHAGGFSTIYKLMAGLTPTCPLCLGECTRPTVTSCVHVFCFDCISSVISRDDYDEHAKCPICRRQIKRRSLMEVKERTAEDDVAEESKKAAVDTVIEEDDEDAEEEEEEEEEENLRPVNRIHGSSSSGSSSSGSSSSGSSSSGSSSSGSSSSSSSGNVSFSNNNVIFVVPPLSATSKAATVKSIMKYEKENELNINRRGVFLERDAFLPSISPLALRVFRHRSDALELSPRLLALVTDIKQVQKHDPFSKFVVFSQFKESLHVAHKLLNDERVFEQHDLYQPLKCVILTNHSDALQEFYTDPMCNVLFLTLGAAATGLTLTMAKTLYILEPSPSAVDEAQAISRIHRIGQQSHHVRCVIFFAKGTCEERLLALREKNRMLTEIISSDQYDVGASRAKDAVTVNRHHGCVTSLNSNDTVPYSKISEQFFSCVNLKCLFGVVHKKKSVTAARKSARGTRGARSKAAADMDTDRDTDSDC